MSSCTRWIMSQRNLKLSATLSANIYRAAVNRAVSEVRTWGALRRGA